jgi:hypothetical protein
MKKIALLVCFLATALQLFAQDIIKKDSKKRDIMGFAEFSPFLAGFQLVSINAGVEFSRFQAGGTFTKGTHLFSHGLNKTTFANYGTLHFLHTQSEEIFVKRFFKKTRKGVYLGMLLNLTHWEVENREQNIFKNTIGKYFTTYAGYRWFPFQKKNDIFYVEPNFGISARLNGKEFTQVGNQSFSFLQPPLELTHNKDEKNIFINNCNRNIWYLQCTRNYKT